jgi:class 3 adenylate cyclase/tetratricopeptide (TPR) repeat protein
MAVCTRCGQENRAKARFCDVCGAPLTEAQAPREERKVVSVLFADLVGSTSTAERMDPEDVRAMQDAYWRHVRSELERHGGTVEKFIGDAVVALFGAPTAHEDDPERALRAALAIRDWAREQDAIQVRIGITTGEALVRLGAQPLAGEAMASGDVVNSASRLQSAAPANAVLVDETTRRATRATIEFGDVEPVVAKGKADTIRACEALEARSRFGVDLFQHARTELVGRQLELDVFRSALTRMHEERSPQLVTLVGVPGIGKSRLVYELMRLVEDDREIVTWRQGRSLPYGDGVSFWALTEIVKAQAGILESDADNEVQPKLAHAVRAVVDDAAEADWIERHLRPLAGITGDAETAADPQSTEAFAAWRRFFEALADSRPAVIVFEDLHWADDALLDFVDSLVERVADVPLLIVATTRPELLARRPTWGGGKANATTLSLAPLSAEETQQLVRALAGPELLPADAEQTLVDHAGGNALYAEQYVQMWEERREAGKLPLPETVQGLIAARLDGLPPSEKSVLQNAAVFGKVFWEGAVVAVDGIDASTAEESLLALQRKQFVQRARRSSVEDESEYAFRHVLVRDVAYAQIPRTRRANKHQRAADWIESLGRPDDHAEMLVHHHVSALELAGRSGSVELRERALTSLIRAGERATGVNAFSSGTTYYEQALQLLEEDDPRRLAALFARARALFLSGDERRLAVLDETLPELLAAGDVERAAEVATFLADVTWLQGRRDVADEHLELATELVRDRPPSRSKASVLASICRFRMLASDSAAAISAGREAIDMAASLGLDDIRAQVLISVGMARYEAGDDGGTADVEAGIDVALGSNHLGAVARGYQNLSVTTNDAAREIDLLKRAEDLWLRLGDVEGARYPRSNRAGRLFACGRWDEALPLIDAFIAECEAGHPHYQEGMARLCRAWARLARDDVERALDDLERAIAVARAAKDPQALFGILGDAAYIYGKLGRLDEGRKLAREMVAADPQAPRWSTGFLMAADRLGLHDDVRKAFEDDAEGHRLEPVMVAAAERRFADAADIATSNEDLDVATDMRVLAAEALLAEGRPTEAGAQLELALAFYRSVRATRFIREIEAQLAEIQSTVG